MSRQLTDEIFDARVIAYLDYRAEAGAARARSPEQVAADMADRLRPSFRIDPATPYLLRLVLLVMLAALLLALLNVMLAGSKWPQFLPVRVVIAMELPLGANEPGAASLANGITLAVNDASGQVGRYQLEIPPSTILSDLVGGVPDGSQGAANMRQIVADPAVVAVIGPFQSSVALQQIPISNAAGLLQCSPGNTNPQLTRTADAAIQPTGDPTASRENYIRVVTTDDAAAAGAARYVFERLGKTSVYVIDDKSDYGISITGWFETEFTRLGGSVVSRASFSNSSAELPAILATAQTTNPQAIYFGGAADQGAALLRAAVLSGLGEIPFVGTEALNDGNAVTPGSFLSLLGDGSRSSAYSVFPGSADGPGKAAFETRYRAVYGADPTPFSVFGYACAQVVIAALQQVDANPPAGTTSLRDAVRTAGVNTDATFDTVLGQIAFDTRGDVMPKRVTIYTTDAGAGDWVYADQIDATAGYRR